MTDTARCIQIRPRTRKQWTAVLSLCLLTLLLAFPGQPQAASLGWLLQSDLRYRLDNGSLNMGRALLQMQLDQAFSTTGACSARTRVYYHSAADSLHPEPDHSNQVEVELKDAYIDLFAFPFSGWQLRIGKQRINVGRSDFFRQLDVINPPDLSDELRFDERVPTWLLRLKWEPVFDTAVELFCGPGGETVRYGPTADPYAVYNREIATGLLQQTGTVWNLANTIDLPSPDSGQITWGLRFSARIAGWGLTLLWASRMQPFPLPVEVDLASTNAAGSIVYRSAREHVLGLGLSGELLGLGIRGELALHKHPATDMVIRLDSVELERSNLVGGDWFLLWSLGIDYQVPGKGPYCNLEFSRGFLGELPNQDGKGVNHYAVLSVEQKLAADRVKLALSLGFEFDLLGRTGVWERFVRHTAWFSGPSCTLSLGDNLELEAGCFIINAPAPTSFARGGYGSLAYLRSTGKF